MECVMIYFRENLFLSCYVSFIVDGDVFFFYEKFGFRDIMLVFKGMYLDFIR